MAHEVRFFCLYLLKLSLAVPSEYMGTHRACQRQLLQNSRKSKYAGQFFPSSVPGIILHFLFFSRNPHLELHDILDLLRRFHALSVKHRTDTVVVRPELVCDLRTDLDPLLCLKVSRLTRLADKA